MKTVIAVLSILLSVLFSFNCLAEEPLQYKTGDDSILDSCLKLSYEQVSDLARTWNNEEQVMELFDQELADSYCEEDIMHPYRVYIFYPTDLFDPTFTYRQNGLSIDSVSEHDIAWKALWNVNMINETGQSHPAVKYLSQAMSLIDCKHMVGFHNTCYISFQLTESSPCYITVLHAVNDESVIVYTTAIWVNAGNAISNLETLAYTLYAKYGPAAFDIIDATAHYQYNP